ncbi:bifunctional DNA primase/polymerase [Desulforhopalus sp. 52FAK]
MTLPSNKMAGWQWLLEEKGYQLIKLARRSKVPVRGESYVNPVIRAFEEVNLDRNGNAGVLTGRISKLIVLDIDDELLFPPEYDIPDTFTVKTAKGYHHYYQLPDDDKSYRCRKKGDLGFDIRADGGYIVAPWSKHPDGPLYRAIEDSQVTDAPSWLLDLSESVASTSSHSNQRSREVRQSLRTINAPEGFLLPTVDISLLEQQHPRSRRSDKIWLALHELVQINTQDDWILWVFESYPNGIGEKYFEKGVGRANWLLAQIDKVRAEVADRFADPVEAEDQESVVSLTKEIKDFIASNAVYITEEHEQSIRDFVNLLIGLYEGSVTGWYSIPIPVAGGKTQTILHFIKFLSEHDTNRSFPISVAFEKIKEIERAADWLEEKGVPSNFYQVVHHEVPDITSIFESLPTYPVILHTHQKLSGSSYVDEYFKYNGEIRKLLIFDESMLNAMTYSASSKDISIKLSNLQREYNLNDSLQESVPAEIALFFMKLNQLIETKERELISGTEKEVVISPDTGDLEGIEYGELIRYSRIFEGKLGGTDLYRKILLSACAPSGLRAMSLIKVQGKPALFATKELFDDSIESLITTDASREFRRLFKYTQRSDSKQIKIYQIDNFRWDDELLISCYNNYSGQNNVKQAFEGDEEENPYLEKILEVVQQDNDYWNEENQMAGPDVTIQKPKYLFFHSKQIRTIPCQIKLRLLEEGLIPVDEINERLFFETFGRENATDEYKDCEVIFFIGLLHKPDSAIDALLAGEGFAGNKDAVREEVKVGEFLQQLQQGIGRGALRQGRRQFVHFFHHKPEIFERDLRKAFPMSYYNGVAPPDLCEIEYLPEEPEDEEFTSVD